MRLNHSSKPGQVAVWFIAYCLISAVDENNVVEWQHANPVTGSQLRNDFRRTPQGPGVEAVQV